ncbi:MbtH family protein [Thermoactinospora rubra]|uniref:MbtH family protein n=1 Tax=Thermoactinospora rubra TaxID=1088767 RepID=UPI000A12099B|nr:MbtH family protein [Thermoactinospora rubra]
MTATDHGPDRTTNPFEDDEAAYLVLVNDENQHSLWPADLEVPAGWRVALERGSRADCLAYVEANWTDMRPSSIARD